MESILVEQAVAGAPTLHLSDIVEEIATNRPGKIDTGTDVIDGWTYCT
jgi:hypothetical protein